MNPIDAFIDDRDDDVPAAGRHVPGLRRANQRHRVKLTEGWIVWCYVDAAEVIRLGVQHVIAPVERGDGFQSFFGRHARDAQAINQIRALEPLELHRKRLVIWILQHWRNWILWRRIENG